MGKTRVKLNVSTMDRELDPAVAWHSGYCPRTETVRTVGSVARVRLPVSSYFSFNFTTTTPRVTNNS